MHKYIICLLYTSFNLDFESLKAEAGPHYVQFIREMSVACRNKGLVLSVDNYVPSSYTAFYNRKEQGIVADYVLSLIHISRKQIERRFGISLVRVPLSVDAFSVDYETMQWFERIL